MLLYINNHHAAKIGFQAKSSSPVLSDSVVNTAKAANEDESITIACFFGEWII
jgi:hypothetical protein